MKYHKEHIKNSDAWVAPFTGAWIEIAVVMSVW